MTFQTAEPLKNQTLISQTPLQWVQYETLTNIAVKFFPEGLGFLYILILCVYCDETM